MKSELESSNWQRQQHVYEHFNSPQPNKTRKQFVRKQLFADNAQRAQEREVKRRDNANTVIYQRSLKKVPIARNAKLTQAMSEQFPLHGSCAEAISFWQTHSKSRQRFKRCSDLTKPDAEYIGDAQWR